MPVYDDPQDAPARQTLEEIFPQRRILPFSAARYWSAAATSIALPSRNLSAVANAPAGEQTGHAARPRAGRQRAPQPRRQLDRRPSTTHNVRGGIGACTDLHLQRSRDRLGQRESGQARSTSGQLEVASAPGHGAIIAVFERGLFKVERLWLRPYGSNRDERVPPSSRFPQYAAVSARHYVDCQSAARPCDSSRIWDSCPARTSEVRHCPRFRRDAAFVKSAEAISIGDTLKRRLAKFLPHRSSGPARDVQAPVRYPPALPRSSLRFGRVYPPALFRARHIAQRG